MAALLQKKRGAPTDQWTFFFFRPHGLQSLGATQPARIRRQKIDTRLSLIVPIQNHACRRQRGGDWKGGLNMPKKDEQFKTTDVTDTRGRNSKTIS